MFRAFDVTKIENLFGENDQLKKENKKDKSLFNLHVMRLLYLILPHTLSKGSNRPGYEDESVTLFNPKYYSINKLIGAC